MLTTLRIKNLALVEDLTLELRPGYNAITGETGAGKSIIIGALNLVLGERASRGLIRAGADQCMVEAVLDVKRVKARIADLLDEHGLNPAMTINCSSSGFSRPRDPTSSSSTVLPRP